MSQSPVLGLLSVAVLMASCGGKSIATESVGGDGVAGNGVGDAAGQTSDTAGQAGVDASGTTAGRGGAGGAGGSAIEGAIDAGTAEAGTVCGKTHDAFELEADTCDGLHRSCSNGKSGQFEISGHVIQSDPNGFMLDSCVPDDWECSWPPSEFRYWAPGLETSVPVDAFVHVTIAIDVSSQCEQRILVKNISQWYGIPNPITQGGGVYLAASDGTLETFNQAPFDVDAVGLGCHVNPPGCSEPADDYALEFREQGGQVVRVGMGEEAALVLTTSSGTESLTFRNLRSYVDTSCDSNWAYWATPSTHDAGG